MATHYRNLCSAFNPSKCTQTVVNTHTHTHTHTKQGVAIGSSVPCSRVSAQSWYWRWKRLQSLLDLRLEPQPLGYKSDSLTIKPQLPRTWMRCALFTSKGVHTHALWYCCERVANSDTEEKKLLNKVIIFVFFAHKKFSRSFITLRLDHWCHMDYFNNVLTTFLGLERVSCFAVYAGSENCRIS